MQRKYPTQPLCDCVLCSQTKMVQHIRKKHPEFGQMTLQTPMPAAAVISTPPAVINADGTTTESVAVRGLKLSIRAKPVSLSLHPLERRGTSPNTQR